MQEPAQRGLAWHAYPHNCLFCRQGVYYGVFPGDQLGDDGVPSTVWVVSRPHNWKPKSTVERLLELDMRTGASALAAVPETPVRTIG